MFSFGFLFPYIPKNTNIPYMTSQWRNKCQVCPDCLCSVTYRPKLIFFFKKVLYKRRNFTVFLFLFFSFFCFFFHQNDRKGCKWDYLYRCPLSLTFWSDRKKNRKGFCNSPPSSQTMSRSLLKPAWCVFLLSASRDGLFFFLIKYWYVFLAYTGNLFIKHVIRTKRI